MKLKALRAGDAHSHEDEECRKRPRSARECAKAHSFFLHESCIKRFMQDRMMSDILLYMSVYVDG